MQARNLDQCRENFLNAIIKKAASDYVKARLTIINRLGWYDDEPKRYLDMPEIVSAIHECRSCLSFFCSDRFSSMTNLNPDYLVEELNKLKKKIPVENEVQ